LFDFLLAGNASGHSQLFSPRQQAKKKRKSRTAFTNHQIFELEKRFLYQKYLSPADRDEIALSLGLTNAQVITWFQNRRAKLKRDMEGAYFCKYSTFSTIFHRFNPMRSEIH
jgi:homeobox protein LBX